MSPMKDSEVGRIWGFFGNSNNNDNTKDKSWSWFNRNQDVNANSVSVDQKKTCWSLFGKRDNEPQGSSNDIKQESKSLFSSSLGWFSSSMENNNDNKHQNWSWFSNNDGQSVKNEIKQEKSWGIFSKNKTPFHNMDYHDSKSSWFSGIGKSDTDPKKGEPDPQSDWLPYFKSTTYESGSKENNDSAVAKVTESNENSNILNGHTGIITGVVAVAGTMIAKSFGVLQAGETVVEGQRQFFRITESLKMYFFQDNLRQKELELKEKELNIRNYEAETKRSEVQNKIRELDLREKELHWKQQNEK